MSATAARPALSAGALSTVIHRCPFGLSASSSAVSLSSTTAISTGAAVASTSAAAQPGMSGESPMTAASCQWSS
ncbi:hypothetical protein [Amycolatopsis sp. NPDC051102]|uniref:hypothetical protein n=1 Tax=Amycolatopsis sp. NPDC051102 TaxID=3155163 RepID=UPI003432FF7D